MKPKFGGATVEAVREKIADWASASPVEEVKNKR
jgi:hypothetical protein